MKDRFRSAMESLRASLRKIEEHQAWIALFESERVRHSNLSWGPLSHAEENRQSEIGWFAYQFLQMRETLAKEPPGIRKKWQKPLERLWGRFQELNSLSRTVV